MRARLLEETPTHRTFALAFEKDDDVEPVLLRFAEEQKIAAAELRGIGGFREVTLAYFEKKAMQYEPIPVKEQVEVVSLAGNFSRFDGKPKLHAHVLIGKKDGFTLAGHLLAARVWPTLELFVTAYATPLERAQDPETNLPLL